MQNVKSYIMKENDDLSNILEECLNLLDDNIQVLTDIELSLESEKEDLIVPILTKDELIDMAHDVADSTRIKKAESSFVRRYFEKTED